jgi:nickel superoxide dismutase
VVAGQVGPVFVDMGDPLDHCPFRRAGGHELSGPEPWPADDEQAVARLEGGPHAVAEDLDPVHRLSHVGTKVAMTVLSRLLQRADRRSDPQPVFAHCDLPCGVYDPAQARIEAESVLKIMEKYHESTDDVFRQRALVIKEERAELVKHHLWVLWTDYFTPEHLEEFPQLHEMFWKATKLAGGTKHTVDVEVAHKLLNCIEEISQIFWKTQE